MPTLLRHNQLISTITVVIPQRVHWRPSQNDLAAQQTNRILAVTNQQRIGHPALETSPVQQLEEQVLIDICYSETTDERKRKRPQRKILLHRKERQEKA